MWNAGEVVIPWELQVNKLQSRFRNFILSLSVRNRLQRPHLYGNKLGKFLSPNSIAASDFD